MKIKFHALNPLANRFPKPSLSVLPVLEAFKFFKLFNTNNPSAFRKSQPFFTNGRSALAWALQLIGVSSEDPVLIPAYHCGSMVEPAIWLKTNVLFYQLDEDLTPNINHIRELIQHNIKPVNTIVVTHFFGFVQPLHELSNLCKEFNINLVEDCAHAYYGSSNGAMSGTVGDYAIASQRKFFPVSDGGGLIDNTYNKKQVNLNRVSIKTEIKLLYNCFENAALYNQLGWFGNIINRINSKRNNSAPNSKSKVEKKKSFLWFVPEVINNAGGRVSKYTIHFSAHKKIIECRRKNYQYLLIKLNELEGVEPLYKKLNEETVPYMFPLIINEPSQYFAALKERGVPIWRWEELAESGCSVSQYYRTHLLHLPCHQSLEKSDLDWIVSEIAAVLNRS